MSMTNFILSNLWKEKKFKEYNIDALGTLPESGHLHPLLKVRTEIRKIFIEMGYTLEFKEIFLFSQDILLK